MGAKADDLKVDCFGLNHLSWFRNITLNGKDITNEVINNPRVFKETEMKIF